jgi:hypothetical protein
MAVASLWAVAGQAAGAAATGAAATTCPPHATTSREAPVANHLAAVEGRPRTDRTRQIDI